MKEIEDRRGADLVKQKIMKWYPTKVKVQVNKNKGKKQTYIKPPKKYEQVEKVKQTNKLQKNF